MKNRNLQKLKKWFFSLFENEVRKRKVSHLKRLFKMYFDGNYSICKDTSTYNLGVTDIKFLFSKAKTIMKAG